MHERKAPCESCHHYSSSCIGTLPTRYSTGTQVEIRCLPCSEPGALLGNARAFILDMQTILFSGSGLPRVIMKATLFPLGVTRDISARNSPANFTS